MGYLAKNYENAAVSSILMPSFILYFLRELFLHLLFFRLNPFLPFFFLPCTIILIALFFHAHNSTFHLPAPPNHNLSHSPPSLYSLTSSYSPSHPTPASPHQLPTYHFPQHPFPVTEATLITAIKNMTSPL